MSAQRKKDSAKSQPLKELGELAGGVILEGMGVPAGLEIVQFVSRYGKQFLQYPVFLDGHKTPGERDLNAPPFLVVGLGRCGCHVIAELAQFVDTDTQEQATNASQKKPGLIDNFLRNNEDTPALKFEPLMLVGDIDETTFSDVDGLLEQNNISTELINNLYRLSYKPIAEGGVGHVPLFAEFITKSLLSLPIKDDKGKDFPWSSARRFLVDNFAANPNSPRLVFYIFSAGGGSGAGSASEIMKVQRLAMNASKGSDHHQIYFTGVAILPENITGEQRKLINTGRTFVQYLADLNIRLEDQAYYNNAPDFQAASILQFQKNIEVPVMPWEGLACISNDVMNAQISQDDDIVTQETIESNANRYIAQQMFNLAAAQSPAASFDVVVEEEDDDSLITKANFQSIRLDPQDLKTSLAGPYGICFSQAKLRQIIDTSGVGIDQMFLRAISLPKYYEVDDENRPTIIEGISVAPAEKSQYQLKLNALWEMWSNNEEVTLSKDDFDEISTIPVFKRCPRIIYVFTAPQEGEIPANIVPRLDTLVKWLCPNAVTNRRSIVRGTTAHYTLSIYIESSIILCPDIQRAMMNYIKLCWQRRIEEPSEFMEQFAEFINQDPPISDDKVTEWLGKTEDYGKNIPNFKGLMNNLNMRWRDYVEACDLNDKLQRRLSKHNVEWAFLQAKEVSSALRYINYVNKFEPPAMITELLIK